MLAHVPVFGLAIPPQVVQWVRHSLPLRSSSSTSLLWGTARRISPIPVVRFAAADRVPSESISKVSILLRCVSEEVLSHCNKDEKNTKSTVEEDGWIHTGDVGLMDEYGRLKIIDRVKVCDIS
jgi:acyl-CoA synthetase (AMP-forming)/AMP-acid ligase II